MLNHATSLYRSADILSASARSALSSRVRMFQKLFALRARADTVSALLTLSGRRRQQVHRKRSQPVLALVIAARYVRERDLRVR